MQMTLAANLFEYLSPLRWAGPVFDKELRVASRRKISYLLRGGYVLLLGILILTAWYSIMGIPAKSLAAFSASRTAVVSTFVAARALWFQFVAAQLITSLAVSLSMTDETRRRMINVLMTTPITSVQLVLGKLLSALLQIGLLLAISLPVLAILRVGGGLAWESVLAGFGITFSAAVFAGALSLLLSTHCRHVYQVVAAGALVYFVAFLVAPALVSLIGAMGTGAAATTRSIVALVSPFSALSRVAPQTLGRGSPAAGRFAWPIHCLTLLAFSVALLLASWRHIRRMPGAAEVRRKISPSIEPLHGSAVLWKERRGTVWYCGLDDILISLLGLGTAAFVVFTPGFRLGPGRTSLHYLGGAFWLVALLRLAISAAGSITREKESGAWPVLLLTPLEDRQIVRAKASAALRRNAVLLLSAFAIQILWFISIGRSLQMMYIPVMLLPRLVAIFLVLACGLYFGVRLQTTTAAVTATVGIYLCLTYLLNGLLGALLFRMLWNPARPSGAMFLSFLMSCQVLVVNVALGAFCLRRARRDLRRYVF